MQPPPRSISRAWNLIGPAVVALELVAPTFVPLRQLARHSIASFVTLNRRCALKLSPFSLLLSPAKIHPATPPPTSSLRFFRLCVLKWRGGGRSDSVLHLRPLKKKNLFGDISGRVQSTGIVKEALFYFFFLPTIKEKWSRRKRGFVALGCSTTTAREIKPIRGKSLCQSAHPIIPLSLSTPLRRGCCYLVTASILIVTKLSFVSLAGQI